MYKQQGTWYKPSSKQRTYAGSLARQLRDRLSLQGVNSPSAHFLAKYFSIDDLRAAIDDIEDGVLPQFEGHMYSDTIDRDETQEQI